MVINTSRGGIVDEHALYQAISSGKLFGAGLDVFEIQPPTLDNPLTRLPTVVAAPHAAGGTYETQARSLLLVDGQPFDVIHLGSNDLLADMGKPGQFDDPALGEAQQQMIAACRRHNKFAGCGGNRDVARQLDIIRKGCQFITTQSDLGFCRQRRRT